MICTGERLSASCGEIRQLPVLIGGAKIFDSAARLFERYGPESPAKLEGALGHVLDYLPEPSVLHITVDESMCWLEPSEQGQTVLGLTGRIGFANQPLS